MHGEQAMSLPILLDTCGQMVLRLSRPHCDGLFMLDAQRRKLVQYDPLWLFRPQVSYLSFVRYRPREYRRTDATPSIQRTYITGALSPASDITPDETLMLNAHKSSVENAMSTKYIRFDTISVMTQVVAGTNFIFTVQVTTNNGGSYSIDVLIHRPLNEAATVLKGVRRSPTQ
jgi:hypothetical protein